MSCQNHMFTCTWLSKVCSSDTKHIFVWENLWPEEHPSLRHAPFSKLCLHSTWHSTFFSPPLVIFRFSLSQWRGRRNNLRLLYIIGVTGRGLFTQPETRTLRQTAVKVCGFGEKWLLGKNRHVTLSPLPQWRRSGTRAHRLFYCGNRMSPAGSRSKHHYGATTRVYVNISEMLLTLRFSRISTAHLRAAMWQCLRREVFRGCHLRINLNGT